MKKNERNLINEFYLTTAVQMTSPSDHVDSDETKWGDKISLEWLNGEDVRKE